MLLSLHMNKCILLMESCLWTSAQGPEGLPWVEASQQWRDRHIYSVFSVILKEISRDRIG